MSTTDPYAVVADNPQFATVLSPTPTQSIPDLMWFLKSSHRESDFDQIQQVLLSRENTFAQSNKELSNRIVDLELRHKSAEEERKRWKRECEAAREERKKAERREIEKVRVLVERNRRLEAEKTEFEKVRIEKEEEVGALVERNRRLEAEKTEFEKVRIEKEEEVRALVERNRRLEAEKGEFEKVKSEKEEEIMALVERNRRLEAEKGEFEKVKSEKEEEITTLVERNRRLEAERAKAETELEEMRGLMDEKVSRMVKEVKALMVAHTRVGENGHSGGGCPPVQKPITNNGKVDDRKGAMSLRKKLVFSPEVSQENSPSVAEKPTPVVPIILSDTDDDDDKMPIGKSLKRKRTSSEPANPPSAASSPPQSEKKLVDASCTSWVHGDIIFERM